MTGTLIILIFFGLLLIGLPVAFSILLASGIGLLLLGIDNAVIVSLQTYQGMRSFPIVAIPLFLLMANLMTVSGIDNALVRLATSLIGHIRGSLAIGNVTASTLFAGISGSGLADTTAVGSMLIPAMIRQGYPPAFAGAVTAAANIVGPIIPPSVLMIIYGYAAGQSVIKLFLAGILPGLLLSLVFGTLAWWMSVRYSYGVVGPAFRWQVAARAVLGATPALLIPIVIVLGVVGGVFTLTESAGVAACYALLYSMAHGLLTRRRIPAGRILEAFRKTAADTAVVIIILGAATLLTWELTISQMPQAVAAMLNGFGYIATLLTINILLLVLGLFLEPAPAILLASSILLPVARAHGIDLVHFGIIMIVNLQIGVLTPPVATAASVTARIAGISFEKQIQALNPFVLIGIGALLIITFVPGLSLWIPAMMGY